ncbi:MAG TPA: NAD(P)H-dependent glycerol-3-phosphate dehydrogenase [Candidatus Omnitrophota bacterium]|nr:NAD(P)H-dependent glycerol-3-phosphate dehydrogenase [Candidatus Omnitrophota bacterium]
MYQKDTSISILGDGGWGTALALLLADQGFRVRLWGAFPKYVEEVRRKRENKKFLPGFKIPENVQPTADIHEACLKADMIVLAVPSQYVRSILQKIKKDKIHHKSFVTVAKGIETKTLKVMSQVIQEELGRVSQCVLSGPTIAREVALKMPAAASVASSNPELSARVRKVFTTDYFTVFQSDDIMGVELGGSLKNVIAISAGIVEGLGYGSNTRAVLLARGTAEMARLGHVMGARRETFMGLSGLGDLATTCLSPHSRNRWLGEEIGKGKKLKDILKGTEMVVEGVDTSLSAALLARRHKVVMPITEAVHAILFKGHDPREAVRALMKREPHMELE